MKLFVEAVGKLQDHHLQRRPSSIINEFSDVIPCAEMFNHCVEMSFAAVGQINCLDTK